MVKPVGDYSDLEQKIRDNSERKSKLSGRKMAMGFTAGAVFAATMGLGGMLKSEAHTQDNTKDPATIKVNPTVQRQDDGKTAQWDYGYSDPNENPETPEQKSEREAEEEYQRIIAGEQTHGDAGTENALRDVKLGDRQGKLTKEDLQKYEDDLKKAYNRSADDIDVDGTKGIDIPQSEDLSQIKNYRQSEQNNPTRQTQRDLALQMVKNSKGNHLG